MVTLYTDVAPVSLNAATFERATQALRGKKSRNRKADAEGRRKLCGFGIWFGLALRRTQKDFQTNAQSFAL